MDIIAEFLLILAAFKVTVELLAVACIDGKSLECANDVDATVSGNDDADADVIDESTICLLGSALGEWWSWAELLAATTTGDTILLLIRCTFVKDFIWTGFNRTFDNCCCGETGKWQKYIQWYCRFAVWAYLDVIRQSVDFAFVHHGSFIICHPIDILNVGMVWFHPVEREWTG